MQTFLQQPQNPTFPPRLLFEVVKHVINLFFTGIRDSIQRGSFEEDVHTFNRVYASKLPERTGQGPRYVKASLTPCNLNCKQVLEWNLLMTYRLRGYQLPASAAHQPKRNPRAYGRLDDVVEKLAESQSSVATPDTDSSGLETHGFAGKA